jgi:hypothetical protein
VGEKPDTTDLKPSTETISLRLPKHLLDSILLAANSRDLPYQSLIKLWLQEKNVAVANPTRRLSRAPWAARTRLGRTAPPRIDSTFRGRKAPSCY